MRRLTATEAARRFSDLLDAVEVRGESFVVERRGRAVASIAPAPAVSGSTIKRLLGEHRPDPAWADELERMRASVRAEERRWNA